MTSLPLPTASSANVPQFNAGAKLLLRSLALILAIAAAAKAYAAWHDRGSVLAWAQVFVELGLSLWFASNFRFDLARRVALVAFAIFAGFSLHEVHERAVSCGCFGHVPVPPEVTFFTDLTIVALLSAMKPSGFAWGHGGMRRLAYSVAVLCVGAGLVAFLRQPMPPNPKLELNRPVNSAVGPLNVQTAGAPNLSTPRRKVDFVGTKISATKWMANLGDVSSGKALNILFRLNSPNHKNLQIRGLSVGCACTSIPDLPGSIAATSATDVMVVFKTPIHGTDFDSEALLTTDDPQLPPLILSIKGSLH